MINTFLKFYLVYFFFIVFSIQSFAQEWERELFFRNISLDEGLSNPSINCMHEDSKGFIWIGTNDGLNRYDGHEVNIHQPNLADSNSISARRIYALCEDSLFNLWIGTDEGLIQFNYRNKKFINFKSEDGLDRVMGIAYDKKNHRIWMACWLGRLKYLDLETGVVNALKNAVLENALVHKLLIFKDELYIGTSNNGVYKLNLSSYAAEEFCNTKTGRFQIPSNDINELHLYSHSLLIGTNGGGLIEHQFKDEKQIYYNHQNSSLPSSRVSSITHDSKGYIYIGTNKGLAIYNNRWELISSHHKEEGNTNALSSNEISKVFIDKKEDLWVGTVQDGVDFQGYKSKYMTLVKKKYTSRNSLSGNDISCFAQDKHGGMWIGTRQEGLNYYKNGKYIFFKADGSENSIRSNSIIDICIDKKDMVWVSTLDNGLCAYENGTFVHYVNDITNPNSIQSNRIRKIEVDKKGNLWLATSTGLESFNIEKKVFKHHFLDTVNKEVEKRHNVRTLMVDSEGNICVGTSIGLYIYNPVSEKSQNYQKDPDNLSSLGLDIIRDIYEDDQKRIWLATMGWGLVLFNRESKTFKSYNNLNGFPDNQVKSIEGDEYGNLWMGTSKGIVKFSPSSEQAVFFRESYGLQNNQFNRRASIKCNDGRLIFGGVDGFNVFRPEELVMEKSPLNVIITDVKLYNQSVPIFGESDILVQDISFVQSLQILYDQSLHFSISFSALQFSNPDQVQYAYKLEGFNAEWNYIEYEHQVSFTSLEPKEYVFKVMASDNGLWNNQVKELGIRIPAPWYMKVWFKAGLVIFLIILVVSFYFYKRYDYKKRQQILERLVNEKNYEINCQNKELISSNKELFAQNEQLESQKEHIDQQNIELKNAYGTLEERVAERTRELNESNKKLNKSIKELDRFVYSASHDLSAPLKSILGLVNIAKLESKEKNLEVHLDYIERSIKKQEKVIKSLIQFSRNSRLKIIVIPLNLSDLVDQIITELKYIPGSECVNIINEIPKNTLINCDEQRLQTILNNLISNGINYKDNDKIQSFVKIQFSANKHSWQLIVNDNGQGIAEDQKEKIFEMFHRANEESDGSGLGLFIVKETVELLGGTISLKSSLKQGSVFELEFPFFGGN